MKFAKEIRVGNIIMVEDKPFIVLRSGFAPSDDLRRWFGHDPERFPEFRTRYRDELGRHARELERLRGIARKGPLTIVYAARDREHNNAVVLAELLREG